MSVDIQNPIFCDDGVDWKVDIGGGEDNIFTYSARDIRDAKAGFQTGMHAWMGVFLKDTLLIHDTFNITRNGERRKLARDIQKLLGEDIKTLYGFDQMAHDLDLICLYLARHYEASRVEVTEFDDKLIYLPSPQIVANYVVDLGGTNFFGPPESLKSQILQTMGVCIRQGICTLWEVIERPVLYINLERSKESFGRREFMVRQALGVKGKSGVYYIHARGHPLKYVTPKVREYVNENPGCVIILDSISRAVIGKLVDDHVGNEFINEMNSFGSTWIGCGHTPRKGDNLFGSRMFEAGEDVGVKVTAGKRAATRGVCLEVVKANDMGEVAPAYYAFDFDPAGSGLMSIRKTVRDEFPDIGSKETTDDLQRLFDYTVANQEVSTAKAAKALDMDSAKVSRLFTKSGRFAQTRRDGHEVLYGAADDIDKALIS